MELNVPEPFVVADSPNASNEISNHIKAEHSQPSSPTRLTFNVSEDSTLIDRFMDEQGRQDFCACTRCGDIFDDDASVALHWADRYCEATTAEEARRAFEEDPERFRAALAESIAEAANECAQERLRAQEPDDGYVIHHRPNVPRVRSRPSEHIILIERETVDLTDLEMEELLKYEGLDFGDDSTLHEIWSEGNHNTVSTDLRFCNIVDGYIPLVKEVRGILPPLADGEIVEVSWQDDPESWFPCKVSKTKRAIYSLDGKLKRLFSPLPSGVKLYITRVGTRRYRLRLSHQPHVVRNCKVFLSDGKGGWKVEFRDENVEWETGNDVFRHRLLFNRWMRFMTKPEEQISV